MMEVNKALLNRVADIAEQAGLKILEVYARDFEVFAKQDQSPLTEADLAAHHHIVAELEKLDARIPVLSEESSQISWQERQQWSTYWLVDPLDGTKEFIKKNGEFTVNIALIDQHKPVLGVVYAPVLGVNYIAASELGAFVRQAGVDDRPINTSLSQDGCWRVVGSRSHAGDSLQAMLDKLGKYAMLSMGSSLKFCLIAEGRADVYPRLGPTSEWDTGAAQCVVEQAGGAVLTLDGQPLAYNTKAELLNPYFIVTADPAETWLQYIEHK